MIEVHNQMLGYLHYQLDHSHSLRVFRMEAKDWKLLLLDHRDHVILGGVVYDLKAKSIGFGVVEISPLPRKTPN
jgi:hypothetical protein